VQAHLIVMAQLQVARSSVKANIVMSDAGYILVSSLRTVVKQHISHVFDCRLKVPYFTLSLFCWQKVGLRRVNFS
jgi:hypothetical protein